MGMYVTMHKTADDGRRAHYTFQSSEGPPRTLVFDRLDEMVWAEDGREDATYRAAATMVSKAWLLRGEMPDRLVYQA